MGFKLRGGRLRMEPVIPGDGPGFELTFRFGSTEHRIVVKNGGEQRTEEIVLVDDGQSRVIEVRV